MPTYWQRKFAEEAADGFALIGLDPAKDANTWRALSRLLDTEGSHLGHGRDHSSPGSYDRLKLACAWRLEHPALWDKYTGAQQQILRDDKLLKRAHAPRAGGLPVKTEAAARGLPGSLRADVAEAVLLHGTGPAVLLNILSTGPNERFSGSNAGTMYGDGTYLAEDAGKTDQYCKIDERYDAGSELHKRLYAHGVHHPGRVFYVLVCRVALGHHVRTNQSGNRAKSMDGGAPIFPVSFRELATVPNVSPPVHYHALLADVLSAGKRYREFIVFHSEYLYPEYVIAYQRFDGFAGPR